MIKLTEQEKQIINELDHPLYTVDFIESWNNREYDVLTNYESALQLMEVIGYCEAVYQMAELQRRKGRTA